MIPFLASHSSPHQHRVGGDAASCFSSLLKAELRTFHACPYVYSGVATHPNSSTFRTMSRAASGFAIARALLCIAAKRVGSASKRSTL